MSRSDLARSSCPSCDGDDVRHFYEVLAAPVNSVLLLASRDQALALPTGDIRLGFCQGCGFIYNTSFDRRLVEYSSRCEETQGFSPFFRAWHDDLARRLIQRYSLHHKRIIEIGCGKGEFLVLLCNLGDNRGIGFDPAYVPGRTEEQLAGRVRFIQDFYSEKDGQLNADFVCCKMTLEHIGETGDFIKMVRRSLRESPTTYLFFQVPDVLRILEEGAFWDIYYEHCSYFSLASLGRLFRRAGIEVLRLRREYNDQYATIEGRVGGGTASPPLAADDDLSKLRVLVDRFATEVPHRISQWRTRLETYREKGFRTVVWGGGSKGVTFLASLNVPGAVQYVVDINPNLAGHYIAKTGVQIVAPSALRSYRPDFVILMNPVYREEIVAELANLGLKPEVISL